MKKQLAITIKQATENDIPIIESILLNAVNWLNEMGQPLWSAEAVTWAVLSKKHQAEDFHIAYLDNKPSGCMAIIDHDPFFWPDVNKGESLFAHKVAVVKDARKSGVSDALINYFKEQGTVRGVKTIRLDVHVKRSRLRNFYERHGFILLEIKEYSDDRDTAFYMYTLPDIISAQNKNSSTRLIFVEGVSGVGKSTLAKNLCDSLCEKGYNAACYLEFDFDNPIDFYCTAYFKQNEYADLLAEYSAYSRGIQANTIFADDVRLIRYYNREHPLFTEQLLDVLRKHEFCWKPSNLVSISEYTRVYKAVWEHFAENLSSHPDYLIFDGSLFHHPINDMMRNYNASSDEVICHVNTLIETVKRLQPVLVYLSSDNTAERLQKARISRKETPPSTEQMRFWEERKQMDMAVMRHISIPYDVYDISQEDWASTLNATVQNVLETDVERRARIYPVILSEYNPAWPEWFAEEKSNLEQLIGAESIRRISHIGSTAVPGLTAKPTIDILLEINESTDIEKLVFDLSLPEYICLRGAALTIPTPPPHLRFIKGYLPNGFADKVYHIHVRYPCDWEEMMFRDYLITHPEITTEYAALKRGLFKNYEHDRDGYTNAKGDFIETITKKARRRKTMRTKEEYYDQVLENRRLAADPQVTKCSCPNTLCDWHGKCKECVALHRHHNDHVPVCLQPIINDKIKALAGAVEMLVEKKEPTPIEYRHYVKERDKGL